MKKFLPLIPFLLVAYATGSTPPTNGNSPQSAAEKAHEQQIIDRATHALKCLKNVQSKAEADAIADEMFALEALLAELAEEGKISPKETKKLIQKTRKNAGFTAQTMKEIEQRLEENHYYGSAKLADMNGGDDELPPAPIDFPESLQEEWGKILQREIEKHPLPFSGGPGFTKETAWTVSLSFGEIDTYVLILENALKQHVKLQKLDETTTTTQQGKTFETHYYAVKAGDKLYKLILWFDMTGCAGDIYVP